jgi:hypothetical protein
MVLEGTLLLPAHDACAAAIDSAASLVLPIPAWAPDTVATGLPGLSELNSQGRIVAFCTDGLLLVFDEVTARGMQPVSLWVGSGFFGTNLVMRKLHSHPSNPAASAGGSVYIVIRLQPLSHSVLHFSHFGHCATSLQQHGERLCIGMQSGDARNE